MKRIVGIVVVLILLASIFTGCTSKTETEQSETDQQVLSSDGAQDTSDTDELNFNETAVLNLDWASPAYGTDMIANPWTGIQGVYSEFMFDTLVNQSADLLSMTPGLATEFNVSDDGLTYTFTCEEGITWHDGEPFTMNDVAFCYNANLKMPEAMYSGWFSQVEGYQDVVDGNADSMSGVKVVSDTELTITLKTPDTNFIAALATIYILPEHLLKDVNPLVLATYEDFFKHPIGTGMYKVDETAFPDYFTMIPYENYYAEQPKIKKIVCTSHEAAGIEALAADMIAGNVDIAEGNAVNDITVALNIIDNNPNIKMVIVPSNYQRQFFVNCSGSSDDKYNEGMKDPKVRQAINLLIDKEAIASMYPEQGSALTTWVNPELAAYNADIPLWKRDVVKAKQMLDEAGFDYSIPLRIFYYYDDQVTKDIMEIIRQNCAEADVIIESYFIAGDGTEEFYETVNYELGYFGNGETDPIISYGTLEPGQIYDSILGDIEERQIFTELLGEYKATSDPVEKKKIGDQIQLIANQQMNIIPLYNVNKIFLYNAGKVDLSPMIYASETSHVHDWDIETWTLLSE